MELLKLILNTPEGDSSAGFPFANSLRQWTKAFVEELVTLLSEALHGGTEDAAIVIRFLLQEVSKDFIHCHINEPIHRGFRSWRPSYPRWLVQ
jgi:hypothetical protein